MKKMITTVLALSLATILSAQPGNGQGQGHKEGRGERIAQELNLSEEQQTQMKELREKHKAEREGWKEMKAKKDELATLLKEEKVDQKAIDAKIQEITKLTEDKTKKHVNHLLEVKKILTPEQFSKFLEIKGKRHGKKGHHNCKGHGNCQHHGKKHGKGHKGSMQ